MKHVNPLLINAMHSGAKRGCLALLLLCHAFLGFSKTFYVATKGSDSAPGSLDQPFATLQKAIDVAGPGDLVYVRGGVYSIVNPVKPSAGIHFYKSGTSESNRIKYFAYPGELPIFDFSGLKIQPDPNYTSGMEVSAAYVHLKGLEVRKVPMNTRSNVGIKVVGGAHHDIFELLDIHHNNGAGLFISGTTGGHLLLNCDSHDNYDPFSHQGNGQNADGFGVHYQESGPQTVIRGCRAWYNSDDGYDFISQEVSVITENCWGMHNGYYNSGTTRPPSGNGNGFKLGSSKTGIRHYVYNNVAWGNAANGFYANHSSGGNDWYNNTAYNNGNQYDMLASTWDAQGNRTDGVTLTGNKVHRMKNNIGYPNKNKNMQGVDEQFNTWNLGITPSATDFLSSSEAGTLGTREEDGSLPDLDFLKLRSGSKMIDRGVDVKLPFNGSRPDLGAYEYGSVITGIVDDESKVTWGVYPSPTNGQVRWSSEKDWILINSMGRQLEYGKGTSADLSAYPSGIYFINMEDKTYRVMKQ